MKIQLTILFSMLIIDCQAQTLDKNDLVIDAYGTFLSQSYQQSILLFNQLIASDKEPRAEWFLYCGIAKFNLNQIQGAELDFQQAERRGDTEAILWNARLKALSGKSAEAVLSIRKYLELTPDPDIRSIQKDSLLQALHGTEEWFSLWQTDWQSDIQKLIADIKYYTKKQDYYKAHSAINDALDKKTDKAFLYALSSTIYEGEGNVELALNEINSALSIETANPKYLEKKAIFLLHFSKNTDALNILSQLLISNPGNFNARYLRANAAMEMGNYAQAKTDIEIYLRYFPSDTAQFLAGQICYLAGNYLEALRYINPLLGKDKSNAAYFKTRGMAYYQTQTYKQAAYDLSMSLDLSPNDAEANYYLGLTEQILGHKKLSCFYLTRARNFGESKAIPYLQENCKE
jgi:tetratricopeptide (TPR) repeat protein